MSRAFEIEKRIQRLLAGDWSVPNLDRIFLYLRERSYGSLVKDIGDFVAHSDTRDKGLSWQKANDLRATVDFLIAMQEGFVQNETYTRHLEALIRELDKSKVKKDSGLSLKNIKSCHKSIVEKINSIEVVGDQCVVNLDGPLSLNEKKTLQHLNDTIKCVVPFSSDEIHLAFADTVYRNNLGDKSAILCKKELTAALSLYVAIKMHLVQIETPDGRFMTLYLAYKSSGNDELIVTAAIHKEAPIGNVQLHVDFFHTGLSAADYIPPEFVMGEGAEGSIFLGPLDIDELGRLLPI